MLRYVGLTALLGSIPFLANEPAHAYPTDFCYERSHFALMVAQDRDKFARKESEQNEECAKSACLSAKWRAGCCSSAGMPSSETFAAGAF